MGWRGRDRRQFRGRGGSEGDYHKAACGYYGACGDGRAGDYAGQVMQRAKAYGFHSGNVTRAAQTAGIGCSGGQDVNAGVLGRVNIAPGANRPGAPLHPQVMGFVAQTAGIVGHPLTISTGMNHSESTTDGTGSDHWTGDAADIDVPQDSPEDDQIAAAALQVAGLNPADAQVKAKQGSLYTLWKGQDRIQVIWKTDQGGNHHNHVHLGYKPSAGPPPASPGEGKGKGGSPGHELPVPDPGLLQPGPPLDKTPSTLQKPLPDVGHTGLGNR